MLVRIEVVGMQAMPVVAELRKRHWKPSTLRIKALPRHGTTTHGVHRRESVRKLMVARAVYRYHVYTHRFVIIRSLLLRRFYSYSKLSCGLTGLIQHLVRMLIG